jgi:magnesium chelatase subunit D
LEEAAPGTGVWLNACVAAALFAVDPHGTGGIVLRAQAGPARQRWLDALKALLPGEVPLRRVPANVADDRLLGGLDLAATLGGGRPVVQKGLLAEADGGVLLLAMAERLTPGAAARIAAALDTGEVAVERDGIAARLPARFGTVAEDEGLEEEAPPSVLAERLGFRIDLGGLSLRDLAEPPVSAAEVAAARAVLPRVAAGEAALRALCATAAVMGIASLRAPLQALAAARAAAALDGRTEVGDDDATLAAALVLAPRATQLPPMLDEEAPAEDETPPDDETPPEADQRDEQEPDPDSDQGEIDLSDKVLEAAAAAIPKGLLDKLRIASQGPKGAQTSGSAGAAKASNKRGRPIGVRAGKPSAGVRLNVLETLRAAAPWQPLRRQDACGGAGRRLEIRAEDFRITRFKQKSETATIFAVDASGSAAFHRLAEAKGAVELLLADCYVRRDQVALVAFRGAEAELLLPPTRSLVRAKRSLAALPGGGGTPLAAGIDAAATLGIALRQRGITPTLVFLTDGQANIGRDGQPGRPQARADAETAARRLAAQGLTALLVDTSMRPNDKARSLAQLMGALYLPLPQADAQRLNSAVRATLAA